MLIKNLPNGIKLKLIRINHEELKGIPGNISVYTRTLRGDIGTVDSPRKVYAEIAYPSSSWYPFPDVAVIAEAADMGDAYRDVYHAVSGKSILLPLMHIAALRGDTDYKARRPAWLDVYAEAVESGPADLSQLLDMVTRDPYWQRYQDHLKELERIEREKAERRAIENAKPGDLIDPIARIYPRAHSSIFGARL